MCGDPDPSIAQKRDVMKFCNLRSTDINRESTREGRLTLSGCRADQLNAAAAQMKATLIDSSVSIGASSSVKVRVGRRPI